jgi:hypothetical protein
VVVVVLAVKELVDLVEEESLQAVQDLAQAVAVVAEDFLP